MSTDTLLNGVSVNGIDPSGTFLTLPLLTVLWHTSQERQNLMTSWRSPGQKKFGSILTSVFFAPRCPLYADSWFTDITYLQSSLGTTNWLKRLCFFMLPVKQSYVVLSDDRLPNEIKTLLKSQILLLKILNSRLVYTGHSLFNLQRVDFITLLNLSPRHNWSGNTLLFSGALLRGALLDLRVPSSTVNIFLGLSWFLLRVSLLWSTLLSLLVGSPKHPSRYITTLVVI